MTCEKSRGTLQSMQATSRGPGRPKLPPGEVRDQFLRIRLTEAERDLIEDAATLDGSATDSEWARELLLREANRRLR